MQMKYGRNINHPMGINNNSHNTSHAIIRFGFFEVFGFAQVVISFTKTGVKLLIAAVCIIESSNQLTPSNILLAESRFRGFHRSRR